MHITINLNLTLRNKTTEKIMSSIISLAKKLKENVNS